VLKNSQVFLGIGPFLLFLAEAVVSHAKSAGGEEIFAIAIVGERSGLADQRVDDVPVLNLGIRPVNPSGLARQARRRSGAR